MHLFFQCEIATIEWGKVDLCADLFSGKGKEKEDPKADDPRPLCTRLSRFVSSFARLAGSSHRAQGQMLGASAEFSEEDLCNMSFAPHRWISRWSPAKKIFQSLGTTWFFLHLEASGASSKRGELQEQAPNSLNFLLGMPDLEDHRKNLTAMVENYRQQNNQEQVQLARPFHCTEQIVR